MISTGSPHVTKRQTSSRIPSLDGLRALSIGLVLFAHTSGTRFFPSFEVSRYKLGNLGVRVFFVISGFLITSLLLEELDATKRISLKWFYIRRALRIFPAAYAYIAVMCLCTAAGVIALNRGDLLHAVTYTVNYAKIRSFYIVHLWSLSVEEQFYFLWPAVLLLSGRRRGLQIAAAVMLAAPALRSLITLWIPKWTWTLGFSFHTNADVLAAGCVLAGIRPWLGTQPWYLRFLRSAWFLAVPAAVIVGSYFETSLVPAFYLKMQESSVPWNFPVMNIGIALIIDRCVRFPSDLVGRILNWRPIAFVGVLSYSTYLWQQVFLNRLSNSPACWFPINLMLTAGAALASYYLIEKPCLDLRKRIERAWAPAKRTAGKAAGPA
jgi:peptidoglycan/LPS O-acetylase OafA/YrhL